MPSVKKYSSLLILHVDHCNLYNKITKGNNGYRVKMNNAEIVPIRYSEN